MSKHLIPLAQEALDIQNACNLCALAQRFAKVQLELSKHPELFVAEARYTHPITILWLDKMNSLAKIQSFEPSPASDRIAEAYNWAFQVTASK